MVRKRVTELEGYVVLKEGMEKTEHGRSRGDRAPTSVAYSIALYSNESIALVGTEGPCCWVGLVRSRYHRFSFFFSLFFLNFVLIVLRFLCSGIFTCAKEWRRNAAEELSSWHRKAPPHRPTKGNIPNTDVKGSLLNWKSICRTYHREGNV